MSETVKAPKRKRRGKLEILVDKTIKNRMSARKIRKIPPQIMTVDIMKNTVVVGKTVTICKDVPGLVLYLELENKKSDMLKESVRTKRFNAAEFQKLKDAQNECVSHKIFEDNLVE